MLHLFSTNIDIDKIIVRIFDIVLSMALLLLLSFPIFLMILISSIETKKISLFKQKRVGLNYKSFYIYKIRSMKNISINIEKNHITTKKDKRITCFGMFIREYKLDEIPQLINILIGNMSFVGPRPDVKSSYDELNNLDDYKTIFNIKPGLISPASLKYLNEELILSESENIQNTNKIIFKDKLHLNKELSSQFNFKNYIKLIVKTPFSFYNYKIKTKFNIDSKN